MTDLTDEALDALVKLLNERPYRMGGESNDEMKLRRQSDRERAAAAITALRQREATAVAGAIEAAANACDKQAVVFASPDYAGPSLIAASSERFACNSCATAIRALHTDATRAALDRVRAEEMREAAAWHIRQADAAMGALHCGSENSEFRAAGRLNDMHRDAASAILAAANKLEGKP